MTIIDKIKRVWHVSQAIATIAGAGTAAPPAQMTDYLAKQYGRYGQQVRSEEIRHQITRLTTKVNQSPTTLSKRDARTLRGK
jgi:hypothetical protein